MILRRDKQVVFYKERTSEHTPVCDRREQRSKARDVPRYEAKKMVRPRGLDKAAEPLQSQPVYPAGNTLKKVRVKGGFYPLFTAERQE